MKLRHFSPLFPLLAVACAAVVEPIYGGPPDAGADHGATSHADSAPSDGTVRRCKSSAECPAGKACDATTHECTSTCSASQPCNGGCCNAGMCSTGTARTACGNKGGMCMSCPSGEACADTCTTSPATFRYTGGSQTYVVPTGVTEVTVEADGAQGGAAPGAEGGSTTATIPVTPGETLSIFVGGDGASGGFNGGGGYSGAAASGGGASDVRRGGSALRNRVVVAGGGGGGAGGGEGGNTAGGVATGTMPGSGGTQTAGGAVTKSPPAGHSHSFHNYGTPGVAGDGGNGGEIGGSDYGGGGGGGYYGGGGGGCFTLISPACITGCPLCGGGGGGSSYAEPTATGVSMSAGVWSGNGQVVITW